MATLTAFFVCRAKSHRQIPHSSRTAIPQRFPVQFLRFQSNRGSDGGYSCSPSLVKAKAPLITTRIMSATEEDGGTAVAEEASAAPTATSDQTVSLSVSPSDVLTMFFQAEGTMNESAIPSVSNALEDIEGIMDLKVQVVEGIASVERRELERICGCLGSSSSNSAANKILMFICIFVLCCRMCFQNTR